MIKSKRKCKSKKGKKPYIAGLAAFYHEPWYSWSEKEAEMLYFQNNSKDWDKILYKNCLDGMKCLPKESVDLVIADSPFGLSFTGKEAVYNRKSEYIVEGYHDIPRSEYPVFSQQWINLLPRLMKETSSAFIFSGWTNLRDILNAVDKTELHLVNHIIWEYPFNTFTEIKFASSHFHILWVVKNPKKYFFNKVEHYIRDVWSIPRTYKRGTLKNGNKLPLALITRCINFCSKPGDVILDPFLGNGSTAEAAKGTFRHFIAFEINQRMKPIIEYNLNNVKLGELYIPYSELSRPDIDALRKKYPKAYKMYLFLESLNYFFKRGKSD